MASKPVQPVAQSPIRALGEIALRVNDLTAMQRFYAEVVGLEVLGIFPKSVFFKIADGYGGHTQILALFDRAHHVSPDQSTIDHIAFTIALADFEAEKARLKGLGLDVSTTEHSWVHWRSLYVKDPEGNTVEWVCYDESV
jgi:catechol-2,3-dioxygenase